MIQLVSVNDEPVQTLSVRLADGSLVFLTLYYKPVIQRWVFDVSYANFSAKGIDLCVHPNILRTWKIIIPFGLSVVSSDNADPFNLDDFVNGRITLFVLDSTSGGGDVDLIEQQVFGEVVT